MRVVEMNKKQSILLVDHDREFCKASKKIFEQSGYAVTLAADGHDALEILARDDVDLIISGLRMPNLDGIELMEEIVRRKIKSPVIFITAYGEVESYMDLMNMGAFDYLNKPVKKEKILDLVEKALESSENAQSIAIM